MKFYELELNGRTVKFRLTSNDCMTIEKSSGKGITEYFRDFSITTVVNLLRYMRRSDEHNFSLDDASKLYDELIDAGYTLETIISDIIMEALVVSGFMNKSELAQMKEDKEEIKAKIQA